MSDFWALVDGEFGSALGRTHVRDHVLGSLGHRTAQQALDAGEDPRTVWTALCDEFDVPDERRFGLEEPQRRTRGRSR